MTICRHAHVESCGTDDDLLVGLQLTHSGRYSFQRPILAQHDPLLDPRTVVDKATGATAGPDYPLLSDAELDRLLDRVRRPRQSRVPASALTSSTSSNATATCSTSCWPRGRGPASTAVRSRTAPGWSAISWAGSATTIPGKLIATRLNVFDGLPYAKGPDGLGVPAPSRPR